MHRLQSLLRLIVASVFIYAAVHKIPDPGAFAEEIRNFKFVPNWIVNAMAIVLPWLELVGVILLVCGFWLREMLWLLGALSASYGVAGFSAWLRGLDIDCGCFGKGYQGSTLSVIAINSVLLTVLLISGRTTSARRSVDEIRNESQ